MIYASDIWFTSDHHFDHRNILKFTGDDGNLIRPGFGNTIGVEPTTENLTQMNEFMVERWNASIKPGDKVYHLGDFCMKADSAEKFAKRLHGKKRLIPGNHDPIKEVARWFEKVQLWRIFKDEGFVCTHIPIRPEQFRHKVALNVHGHLHQNVIQDPLYKNICVEVTDYAPLHIDDLIKIATKNRD